MLFVLWRWWGGQRFDVRLWDYSVVGRRPHEQVVNLTLALDRRRNVGKRFVQGGMVGRRRRKWKWTVSRVIKK